MTTIKTVLYFTFFVILITSLSCESSHRTSSLKTQYKSAYLDQFKLTYFRQLLIKSYNNSNAVKEIVNADRSGFTELILTEADIKLIDSLTSMDNQYLIADSIDGFRRAEGSQGKRPLGFIMYKLKSKWLDSLAQQRLKINGDQNSWTY